MPQNEIINEIFERITKLGTKLTLRLLEHGLNPIDQLDSEATHFGRRTPEQSEITLTELTEKSSTYLFNKIRMLQDPYPNAFIRCADGRKLLIKDAKIED